MSHLEKGCQPASPDLPLRLWDMTEVPLGLSPYDGLDCSPWRDWVEAPGTQAGPGVAGSAKGVFLSIISSPSLPFQLLGSCQAQANGQG